MKHLFWVMVAVLLPFQASAFSVKNLSGEPQTLYVDQGGTVTPLHLQPNEVRHYFGENTRIFMEGERPTYAHYMDQYIIWPEGKLHVQRRQKNRNSGH